MEEKSRHERYHGSFEALFTQIVAPFTKKSGGYIGLQYIRYHKDKTLSSTLIEKSIMENECFWHEKMI